MVGGEESVVTLEDANVGDKCEDACVTLLGIEKLVDRLDISELDLLAKKIGLSKESSKRAYSKSLQEIYKGRTKEFYRHYTLFVVDLIMDKCKIQGFAPSAVYRILTSLLNYKQRRKRVVYAEVGHGASIEFAMDCLLKKGLIWDHYRRRGDSKDLSITTNLKPFVNETLPSNKDRILVENAKERWIRLYTIHEIPEFFLGQLVTKLLERKEWDAVELESHLPMPQQVQTYLSIAKSEGILLEEDNLLKLSAEHNRFKAQLSLWLAEAADREIRTQKEAPLLEISQFPDDFYKKLVIAINESWVHRILPAVDVLYRKLLENLLIDILRANYGLASLNIFYNRNRKHFHHFAQLMRELKKRLNDFKPIEPELNSNLLRRIDKFRLRGNESAHSLTVDITESDIKTRREEMKYLAQVLFRTVLILRDMNTGSMSTSN